MIHLLHYREEENDTFTNPNSRAPLIQYTIYSGAGKNKTRDGGNSERGSGSKKR